MPLRTLLFPLFVMLSNSITWLRAVTQRSSSQCYYWASCGMLTQTLSNRVLPPGKTAQPGSATRPSQDCGFFAVRRNVFDPDGRGEKVRLEERVLKCDGCRPNERVPHTVWFQIQVFAYLVAKDLLKAAVNLNKTPVDEIAKDPYFAPKALFGQKANAICWST